MTDSGRSLLAAGEVALGGVLWGVTGIFVRYFNGIGLGSTDVVWIRVTMAALAMSLFLLIKDPSLLKFRLRDVWCFIGTGIFSLAFFNYFYFINITETSLSVACTLLYLSPVFVLLYSMLLFRERLTVRKAAACLLTVLGCALVTGILSDFDKITGRGLVFGVLSGAGYALYSIFSRCALKRGYHAFTITAYTFIFASLGMTPLVRFGNVASSFTAAEKAELIFFLLMLAGGALPYILYTDGLRIISASKASVLAALEPVTAMLVGAVFYRERLTLWGVLGTGIVLFAIFLLNSERPGKGKTTKKSGNSINFQNEANNS